MADPKQHQGMTAPQRQEQQEREEQEKAERDQHAADFEDRY